MTVNAKTLSDIMDVDFHEVPANKPIVPVVEAPPAVDNAVDDDYVRSNIYQFIEAGKEAIHGALAVAQQSETPRAFEAFGTLLKNVADINRQLIEVQEIKHKMTQPTKADTPSVQNNAVFVGSTAELAAMLKDMR